MFVLKLAIRNAFRHRLRAALTILGVAIAIFAFGLLRMLVGLWYLGVETSSATRLVTRNAISLIFPLPAAYQEKIRQCADVTLVSRGNWFGGIYIDPKNFFPNFAVEPASYLELYPEFTLSAQERDQFIRDRKGAVAGRKLAQKYGWRLGDQITLKGTIYPGDWPLVLCGIYTGKYDNTDETQFFFHWDYVNETVRQTMPGRADQVGFYMIGVKKPEVAAQVAEAIDAQFKNSLAETLTETEKAFQLGFVAMTEALMIAIEIVSYVVIAIIMVVAANTMAMTARERTPEYATLKTLGFGGRHIVAIILGESLCIALLGGLLGVAVTFPAAHLIESELSQFFPVMRVSADIVAADLLAALLVGGAAAVFPAWRGITVRIAQGFRRIG